MKTSRNKTSRNITRQEGHINWMLNSQDPNPLSFFRHICPAHRKETVDDANIQKDWETWLQEKAAIIIRRDYQSRIRWVLQQKNTNSNPDPDASEKEEDDEDEDEECAVSANEIDKFFMDKGNNNIHNDDIDGIHYVERHMEESESTSTCRSWVLRSGTNVREQLARYIDTIPEAQKCLNLAYWNILDLTEDSLIKSFFSTEDWNEITKSFEDDVKLFESDVPDITKNEDENIIDAIDKLTSEIIENNQNVKLTNEDKKIVATIRRAVVTYAENLKGLELPVSESDFDNAFPNMLTKRFLDKQDLKMDVYKSLNLN
ncbi:unnamed protein product [Rhizophagus irregularis]|nr:unnamed protein product [Rhizophagus irregularis]